MQTATVKWYNATKGYGFLEPDAGGDDVFVHASTLQRCNVFGLQEGQKVAVEIKLNERTGKKAAATIKLGS